MPILWKRFWAGGLIRNPCCRPVQEGDTLCVCCRPVWGGRGDTSRCRPVSGGDTWSCRAVSEADIWLYDCMNLSQWFHMIVHAKLSCSLSFWGGVIEYILPGPVYTLLCDFVRISRVVWMQCLADYLCHNTSSSSPETSSELLCTEEYYHKRLDQSYFLQSWTTCMNNRSSSTPAARRVDLFHHFIRA